GKSEEKYKGDYFAHETASLLLVDEEVISEKSLYLYSPFRPLGTFPRRGKAALRCFASPASP
ncbi:MAG TPA: hypothetical protein VI522_07615, partial [Gammaproteobacteria bacterium]|nr:hypothetical protein [Gammaproteobacteria bacterium]